MSDVCCIKGCDRAVLTMGLCTNHYRMNRVHGSPVAVRPLAAINRGLSNEQRFWKSVRKTDGCWIWQASRDRDGYGVFAAEIYGVYVRGAHRFSYMLGTGEVLQPHQLVMHSCDTPCCVRPSHLRAGSSAENSADMVARGRSRGGRPPVLTDEQVVSILTDARPYAAIAEEHGIHKQHVLDIKARRTRRDVQIAVDQIVRNKRGSAGEARSKNLSDDDVRYIRASEESGSFLARQFGLTPSAICDIRKRRSWKHVA